VPHPWEGTAGSFRLRRISLQIVERAPVPDQRRPTSLQKELILEEPVFGMLVELAEHRTHRASSVHFLTARKRLILRILER
jgi:hypothetical protein